MKFTEENIGVNLCDPRLGNGFLDMTTKAQATKDKIDKLTSSKLKSSVFQRTPSRT